MVTLKEKNSLSILNQLMLNLEKKGNQDIQNIYDDFQDILQTSTLYGKVKDFFEPNISIVFNGEDISFYTKNLENVYDNKSPFVLIHNLKHNMYSSFILDQKFVLKWKTENKINVQSFKNDLLESVDKYKKQYNSNKNINSLKNETLKPIFYLTQEEQRTFIIKNMDNLLDLYTNKNIDKKEIQFLNKFIHINLKNFSFKNGVKLLKIAYPDIKLTEVVSNDLLSVRNEIEHLMYLKKLNYLYFYRIIPKMFLSKYKKNLKKKLDHEYLKKISMVISG